jgi:hypothetical protein
MSTRAVTYKTKSFAQLTKEELLVLAKIVLGDALRPRSTNERQLRTLLTKDSDISDTTVFKVERNKGQLTDIAMKESSRGQTV